MLTLLVGLAASAALQASPQTPLGASSPIDYDVREDLTYLQGRHRRRHQLDLFVPRAEMPPPLVMFVHGGTWTGGGKQHFSFVGRALASHGFACAVINMRLFPFATPAEMVADCRAALAWLHAHGDDHGYDGARLFVMGHSSGAHLCSWLAYDDEALRAAGVPRSALRGAVLLSGIYEVRPRHAALDGVFGREQERRRQASPWLRAGAGAPPTMIVWGDRDLPGFSLCGRMLRDRLRRAKVPVSAWEYTDQDHVQTLFGLRNREGRELERVLQFLRRPKAAQSPVVGGSPNSMLWVADGERERKVGLALARVLEQHGVEVIVRNVPGATGQRVAQLFRELRKQRLQAKATPLAIVGGAQKGGLAVASAPLGRKVDGLEGRLLASTALGPIGMKAAGMRPGQLDLSHLGRSSLLSLYGDREPELHRRESFARSAVLQQRGHDAHPIELAGTTAERALLDLAVDDDLLLPLLLAFVRR